MLVENIIDDDGRITVRDKVQIAIQRLKSFEPPDGYWLAFSGGKDSVVLLKLAEMSEVKFEAHYSITNVDPPELVNFIKTFPNVTRDQPKETMWRLIIRKRMPPTQKFRYCCESLKESSGKGRVTLTGVRWDESVRRKKTRNLVNIGNEKNNRLILNDENDESRRTVEQCYRTKKTLVNPIIDWLDEDVWEFIGTHKVRYCSLYDEGWKRLGCIGCPMGSLEHRNMEFLRWPKFKEQYIRTFGKMTTKRIADGLAPINGRTTGQEYFDWWMNLRTDYSFEGMDGQIEIEESDGEK